MEHHLNFFAMPDRRQSRNDLRYLSLLHVIAFFHIKTGTPIILVKSALQILSWVRTFSHGDSKETGPFNRIFGSDRIWEHDIEALRQGSVDIHRNGCNPSMILSDMNQNILLRNTEPRRRVPLCHGVLRNADIGAVLPVTIHVLHLAFILWYGTCGENDSNHEIWSPVSSSCAVLPRFMQSFHPMRRNCWWG